MSDFTTELTAETIAAIVPESGERIDLDTVRMCMNERSGSRPRVYAYLERGESAKQIVRLTSHEQAEPHLKNIGVAWLSHTTVADLINRAV